MEPPLWTCDISQTPCCSQYPHGNGKGAVTNLALNMTADKQGNMNNHKQGSTQVPWARRELSQRVAGPFSWEGWDSLTGSFLPPLTWRSSLPKSAHSKLPLLMQTPSNKDPHLNLCLLKPRKIFIKQSYFAFRRNCDQAFPGLQLFSHLFYLDMHQPRQYVWWCSSGRWGPGGTWKLIHSFKVLIEFWALGNTGWVCICQNFS